MGLPKIEKGPLCSAPPLRSDLRRMERREPRASPSPSALVALAFLSALAALASAAPRACTYPGHCREGVLCRILLGV